MRQNGKYGENRENELNNTIDTIIKATFIDLFLFEMLMKLTKQNTNEFVHFFIQKLYYNSCNGCNDSIICCNMSRNCIF